MVFFAIAVVILLNGITAQHVDRVLLPPMPSDVPSEMPSEAPSEVPSEWPSSTPTDTPSSSPQPSSLSEEAEDESSSASIVNPIALALIASLVGIVAQF